LQAFGGEAPRDAIRDRALHDGNFSRRELEAPAPERADKKYERLVDHELSWALTNLKRDGLVQNPTRGVWRLIGPHGIGALTAAGKPVAAERLAELRALPYPLYLRTPEWRRARAVALLAAGNCCSLDVTHTTELEVHHRTYERLGAELVSDLVVLCHPCHQLHHGTYGRPRRGTPEAAPRVALSMPTAAKPERLRSGWLGRLLAH
jgi:restriction endonuclease Mrr